MAASVVSELDQLLVVNTLLPGEVGLFRQRVEYTCLHACGDLLAVGSEQGYVRVIDTAAKKVLRELTESKSAIKRIRLCSAHSFLALGLSDGLLIVSDINKTNVKTHVKERDSSPVTALLWNDDGDKLFVGYTSGKLLSFTFNKVKAHLDITPLLECGSQITSLSYSAPHLLISSLNLTLLINTDSGASTQVGSRPRKPGEYGGCFLPSSGEAVVGRPGLRLWLTDNQGKVLSTAKYKDVLLDHSHPVIPLFGGVLLPLVLRSSWQLSSIQPLGDEWVVVSHENTVLVLEPQSLTCIGGISLGQSIIDMATDRRSVYLLCKGHQRKIVKLSMPAEEPTTAVLPQPSPVEEKEVKMEEEVIKVEKEPITEEVKPISDDQSKEKAVTMEELTEENRKEERQPENSQDFPVLVVTNADDEETAAVPSNEKEEDVEKDGPMDDSVAYRQNGTVSTNDDNSIKTTTEDNEQDEEAEIKEPRIQDVQSASSPSLFVRARNIKIGQQVAEFKSKLTSVSEQLIRPYSPQQDPTPTVPEQSPFLAVTHVVSEEEALRRAKMAEVADEDDLVVQSVSKVKRNKTKRRKKRHKLTPSSSTHSSIERLQEALEEEENRENTKAISVTPVFDESPSEIMPPVMTCNDPEIFEDDREENDQLMKKKDDAVNEVVEQTECKEEEEAKDIVPTDELDQKADEGKIEEELPYDDCLLNVLPHPFEEEQEEKTEERSPFIPRRRAYALKELEEEGESTAQLPLPGQEDRQNATSTLASSRDQELSNTLSESSMDEDLEEHLALHHFDSDVDEEEEEEKKKRSHRATRVESGFYHMLGDLVKETKQSNPADILPPHRRSRIMTTFVLPKEDEEEEKAMVDDMAMRSDSVSYNGDIWTPIPIPGGHVQCVCLSNTSLWITDLKGSVFWSRPDNRRLNWEPVKHPMNFISSSSSGKIVWGVYNGHAYTRLGISDLNQSGSTWKNITKSTPMKRQVKMVACDENAIWMLMLDGKVFFRKEVSEGLPDGSVWREIPTQPLSFNQIACCDSIVWALDAAGKSYVREGITGSDPTGEGWTKVGKVPLLAAISVTASGIVWGVDLHSRLFFHCGASSHEPSGSGQWWETTHTTISKTPASSPTDSLLKFMSIERSNTGSLLMSMSSRISAGLTHRLLGISACMKSGVCVLTSDSQLHACWGNATGFCYEKICKDDIFNLSIWSQVEAGHLAPWVIRDDGELCCVPSITRIEHVECQGKVTNVAASSSALWVVSKQQIWSRQGITPSMPHGISWDYIELGSHMQHLSIVKLAIGNRVAWALDHLGHVHFRFGIHPREPGTGMAPAWIPVEDNAQPFVQIAISSDDLIVWACDKNNNVYARIGVTSDFPVGTQWELVPGEQAKQLAAAKSKVFTLTPSGGLLARHGVSDSNPTGDYWRRLPGKFERLSLTSAGHLLVINERGSVLKQLVKVMPVCVRRQSRSRCGTYPSRGSREVRDLEKTVTLDEWEVL